MLTDIENWFTKKVKLGLIKLLTVLHASYDDSLLQVSSLLEQINILTQGL